MRNALTDLGNDVMAGVRALHCNGFEPAAVVVGEDQWCIALRCARQSDGVLSISRNQILGLTVLTSRKVVGPLVVTDDVRHSLQTLGIFEVTL